MTDLLDRPEALDDVPTPEGSVVTSPRVVPSMPLRIALACLLVAGGVIHFAMVPAHAGESLVDGLTFAAAGWIQLILAVALVVRPSRRLLGITIVTSLVFVAAWALSRVVGLPYGAHKGIVEPVSSVDLLTVACEVGATVLAVVALRRPRLGATWSDSTLVMASILPLIVLIGVTSVVTSPSATNHAHGGVAAGGHSHLAAGGDDLGLSTLTNGHVHAHAADVVLDQQTQVQLNKQLAQTSQLAVAYPTVAAAEAAGYHRAGPFTPGLGAHYMPPATSVIAPGATDEAGLSSPMLIYDGMEPDSLLAGYMYLAYQQTEPAGFAGPNDHWHFHTNVCITVSANGSIDAPLGADAANVDQSVCDRYGGRLIDNTGYMLHVWTVPGYESSNGLFSDLNPAIKCPDGTYHHIELTDLGMADTTCLS
ncbi:MAG: hypothetical protein WCK41_05195 [Actinomycetes bacterium]